MALRLTPEITAWGWRSCGAETMRRRRDDAGGVDENRGEREGKERKKDERRVGICVFPRTHIHSQIISP